MPKMGLIQQALAPLAEELSLPKGAPEDLMDFYRQAFLRSIFADEDYVPGMKEDLQEEIEQTFEEYFWMDEVPGEYEPLKFGREWLDFQSGHLAKRAVAPLIDELLRYGILGGKLSLKQPRKVFRELSDFLDNANQRMTVERFYDEQDYEYIDDPYEELYVPSWDPYIPDSEIKEAVQSWMKAARAIGREVLKLAKQGALDEAEMALDDEMDARGL